MPDRKSRSRSMRKVFVKVPGGDTKIQRKKPKPSRSKCAGCGTYLSGTPREFARRMKSMPKTMKRPQRPYGGYFCTRCTRKLMVDKYRQ